MGPRADSALPLAAPVMDPRRLEARLQRLPRRRTLAERPVARSGVVAAFADGEVRRLRALQHAIDLDRVGGTLGRRKVEHDLALGHDCGRLDHVLGEDDTVPVHRPSPGLARELRGWRLPGGLAKRRGHMRGLEAVSLANKDYVAEQYRRWQEDPGSVDERWAIFFAGFDLGADGNGHGLAAAENGAAQAVVDTGEVRVLG